MIDVKTSSKNRSSLRKGVPIADFPGHHRSCEKAHKMIATVPCIMISRVLASTRYGGEIASKEEGFATAATDIQRYVVGGHGTRGHWGCSGEVGGTFPPLPISCTASSSIFKPLQPLQASSSLFKPHQASSSLFKPLQASSSLFKPLQASSSLFKPLHASSSLFKPLQALLVNLSTSTVSCWSPRISTRPPLCCPTLEDLHVAGT